MISTDAFLTTFLIWMVIYAVGGALMFRAGRRGVVRENGIALMNDPASTTNSLWAMIGTDTKTGEVVFAARLIGSRTHHTVAPMVLPFEPDAEQAASFASHLEEVVDADEATDFRFVQFCPATPIQPGVRRGGYL